MTAAVAALAFVIALLTTALVPRTTSLVVIVKTPARRSTSTVRNVPSLNGPPEPASTTDPATEKGPHQNERPEATLLVPWWSHQKSLSAVPELPLASSVRKEPLAVLAIT